MRGTKQEVLSEGGFEYLANSPVEAKYIFYAHQRGNKEVAIPAQPFLTFKIVKKYEVFVRDLQNRLLQTLVRRTRYKGTAEQLAKRCFKEAGLPWLEEER